MNETKFMDRFKLASLKNNLTNLIILILTGFLFTFCRSQKKERLEIPSSRYIAAQAETKPVHRDSSSDAADDPAIWINHLKPDSSDYRELLPLSTENDNLFIEFDIEGLAIYNHSDGDGYLIASSQGNDSYAVFERKPPNKYTGSFKIVDSPTIDGSQKTDGIEVTSTPLGKNFPAGLFVTQDGENTDNGAASPQNFKLIRWDSIAIRFNPPLKLLLP